MPQEHDDLKNSPAPEPLRPPVPHIASSLRVIQVGGRWFTAFSTLPPTAVTYHMPHGTLGMGKAHVRELERMYGLAMWPPERPVAAPVEPLVRLDDWLLVRPSAVLAIRATVLGGHRSKLLTAAGETEEIDRSPTEIAALLGIPEVDGLRPAFSAPANREGTP